MRLDDLRSDLKDLAATDPAAAAELVFSCVTQHPHLEGLVRRLIKGALPTRTGTDGATAPAAAGAAAPATLPAASAATLAAVRAQYETLTATREVRHRPDLVIDDVAVDISVRPGQAAVIIGGNLASLQAIASLAEALAGDVTTDLARIADAIAEQLSGNLSRRSMTRGRARPPQVAGTAPTVVVAEGEQDPTVQALQLITAVWPPAAGMRREKGEPAGTYLGRLLGAARAAAATSDADATAALTAVAAEFPDLVLPS